MKYYCVECYSEEKHIKNTRKACSFSRKLLNLLSITCIILAVVLNLIIIYDKNETMDPRIDNIYRRNLSELKNVQNRGLKNRCEKNKLKNIVDEKNNNTLLTSDFSNSEDYIKYNDVTTKEKYNNINYNDLSKQLNLQELYNILEHLKDRPSISDLYNIWNHVLGVSKEGFDDILKYLSFYIEEYLLTYEYPRYDRMKGSNTPIPTGTKYSTWYKSMHDIGIVLSSTDMEYTVKFYNLIKDGASIDEMKIFIYSYIKYYVTLKNDIYNEHKRIFTERMKNPQRLNI